MIDNLVRYHDITEEMREILFQGKCVILDNQNGWRRLLRLDERYKLVEGGKFSEELELIEIDLINNSCPTEHIFNSKVIRSTGYPIPMMCGHPATWKGYSVIGCKLCGFDEKGNRIDNDNAFIVDEKRLYDSLVDSCEAIM